MSYLQQGGKEGSVSANVHILHIYVTVTVQAVSVQPFPQRLCALNSSKRPSQESDLKSGIMHWHTTFTGCYIFRDWYFSQYSSGMKGLVIFESSQPVKLHISWLKSSHSVLPVPLLVYVTRLLVMQFNLTYFGVGSPYILGMSCSFYFRAKLVCFGRFWIVIPTPGLEIKGRLFQCFD